MARQIKKSKANAALKANPQRQTRSRSKFFNSPPLMTGLNDRGQPIEALPVDQVISYAEALKQEEIHKKLIEMSNEQAKRDEEEARKQQEQEKSSDESMQDAEQSDENEEVKCDQIVPNSSRFSGGEQCQSHYTAQESSASGSEVNTSTSETSAEIVIDPQLSSVGPPSTSSGEDKDNYAQGHSQWAHTVLLPSLPSLVQPAFEEPVLSAIVSPVTKIEHIITPNTPEEETPAADASIEAEQTVTSLIEEDIASTVEDSSEIEQTATPPTEDEDAPITEKTSNAPEQSQTGHENAYVSERDEEIFQDPNIDISEEAKAIIRSHSQAMRRSLPNGKLLPFPSRAARWLDQILKTGAPTECDHNKCDDLLGCLGECNCDPEGLCECNREGLCEFCEGEWAAIAELRDEHGTVVEAKPIVEKRGRDEDDTADEPPHKKVKVEEESTLCEPVYPSMSFASGSNPQELRQSDSSAMDIDEDGEDDDPQAIQEEPEICQDSMLNETLIAESSEEVHDEPATKLVSSSSGGEDLVSPPTETEYGTPSNRPDRGMNTFFHQRKSSGYVPDHDNQDAYDPAKPQDIEPQPLLTEYKPDHSDNGDEYDPVEGQEYVAPTEPLNDGGADIIQDDYQSIGLNTLGPFSPDIKCVGCQLNQASSETVDQACLDCKIAINRRLSYSENQGKWMNSQTVENPFGGSRRFTPINVAHTTAQNPRIMDLEGPDAGYWDARVHGEDEWSESEDKEDHIDW